MSKSTGGVWSFHYVHKGSTGAFPDQVSSGAREGTHRNSWDYLGLLILFGNTKSNLKTVLVIATQYLKVY